MYDFVYEIEYFDCVMNEFMWFCLFFYIFNWKCEEICVISLGFIIFVGMDVIILVYVFYYDFEVWFDFKVYDLERFWGFVKEVCYLF